MLKTCKYCGGRHPVGTVCPERAKRRYLAQTESKRGKTAAKFRSSYAWTKTARRIKERDNHLCRYCLKNGIVKTDELETHHIIPIEADYNKRLDDDNLITLCAICHKKADSGEISAEELRALAAETVAETVANAVKFLCGSLF